MRGQAPLIVGAINGRQVDNEMLDATSDEEFGCFAREIGWCAVGVVAPHLGSLVRQRADDDGSRLKWQGLGPALLQRAPRDQLVARLRSGLSRLRRALCINRLNGSQQGGQQPRRYLAMRVECLSRKVSDAFRVSAVAMRNQGDDIAIATRA